MMISINGILNDFSFSWEWKSTYASTVPWSQKGNLQRSPSTRDLKDPASQGAGISTMALETMTSMSASGNSFLGVVCGRKVKALCSCRTNAQPWKGKFLKNTSRAWLSLDVAEMDLETNTFEFQWWEMETLWGLLVMLGSQGSINKVSEQTGVILPPRLRLPLPEC